MNLAALIDKLIIFEEEALFAEDVEVVVSGPYGKEGSIKVVIMSRDGDGKNYIHISA